MRTVKPPALPDAASGEATGRRASDSREPV